MASPPGHPPSQYEPVGRLGHCSAIVDGKLYTYGGDFGAGVSPPLSMVEILNLEKWQQIPSTGETPPGHIYASCAVIGAHIFHFGGMDMSGRYYNTIHQFDTRVLRWNPITATNTQEGPRPKINAGMIDHERHLVISGGYTDLPDQHLPGREYVPNPDHEGYGWTNELHCFHVDSSELC